MSTSCNRQSTVNFQISICLNIKDSVPHAYLEGLMQHQLIKKTNIRTIHTNFEWSLQLISAVHGLLLRWHLQVCVEQQDHEAGLTDKVGLPRKWLPICRTWAASAPSVVQPNSCKTVFLTKQAISLPSAAGIFVCKSSKCFSPAAYKVDCLGFTC